MGLRLKTWVLVGMGLLAAACGGEVARRQGDAQEAAVQVQTGPSEDVEVATRKKEVVVDVDRPWMKWGEARPDAGRGRPRTDPTRFWSDEKALEKTVPVTATRTAATREAIPKAVEPGSRVGSVPGVGEPGEILGK